MLPGIHGEHGESVAAGDVANVLDLCVFAPVGLVHRHQLLELFPRWSDVAGNAESAVASETPRINALSGDLGSILIS